MSCTRHNFYIWRVTYLASCRLMESYIHFAKGPCLFGRQETGIFSVFNPMLVLVGVWEDLGHGPRDGEAQYEVLGTVWACSGVPGPSRMPETSGFYLVLVYLGTHGCLRNVENGLGMHRMYLARGWGEKEGSCSWVLLGGVFGLGLTWWQIWLGAQRGLLWEISGGSVDKDLLYDSLWWKLVKKGSPCLSVFIRFSFKFQILSPFHISS